MLVDGTWYAGELRAWFSTSDGGWRGNVQYGLTIAQNRLDKFLALEPQGQAAVSPGRMHQG